MRATFGDRLSDLHSRALDHETNKPFTQRAVVEKLHALGVQVSGAYFNQLLHGSRERPSFEIVNGLAKVYNVRHEYFDLDNEEVAQEVLKQLDFVSLAHDQGLHRLMMRAGTMSDDPKALLAAVIEALNEENDDDEE